MPWASTARCPTNLERTRNREADALGINCAPQSDQRERKWLHYDQRERTRPHYAVP